MKKYNSDLKLTPKIIFVLIMGSILFTVSILYTEEYINKKAQYKSLEEVSKAYSISLQSFRDFYSKVILDKIHDSEIEITHDYQSKDKAVPIPATMTLDLINYLNNNNAKANVKLTSPYPFPWRENRESTKFEKDALEYFSTTSKNSYSKLEQHDNVNIFQYAIPIRMQANCVGCHNSHPQSPKTGWKVGDIRGIQVISLEPEVIHVNNVEDRIYFIIIILLFFTFNISVIIWLLQRNNFAFLRINKDKVKITEALAAAKKASKAKDNFLANISHELRTPLNAIIGFSDILTDAKLPATEHEQAKIISTSSKSLLSIINDILDFSKMESGKFDIKAEEASIYDVSKHLFTLFDIPAKEKDITLNYHCDSNIPQLLRFDSQRLEQVISNLLGNAIKFTPKNGTIDFNLILENSSSSEATIRFEIKDSGIGIPEEKQEVIFQPFSQADDGVSKKYGGTGLGLTIISKILQLMNSRIELKSKENEGSLFSFVITFPIISNNKQIKKDVHENEESNIEGSILIAEDNPINRKLMEAMLSKLSLQAEFAYDGLEAINKVKDKRYDLIFMDINMPKYDGMEATLQIREYETNEKIPQIPIVALTANAIKGDKEKYLNIGMTDYIDKPINFQKLKSCLEKYLTTSITPHENTYTIKKVMDNLDLDESSVKLLINNFFKTLDEDLEKLQDAIDKRDTSKISTSAHYIKSASINFCMDKPTKILENIEIKAQCGDMEGYELDSLKKAFMNIKKTFAST